MKLLDELREAVGPAHVLTHDDATADLSAWEQDWRKRTRGRALAVVRPGDTAEVAAVVRACAAAGTAIVPQGGNTGLVVGSIPDGSGTQVLLSLTRLNTVRGIDADNLTMTVDAGCVLQTLQETAEKAGFLFPLSLAAEGSCTIGGNLGTNAGGTQVADERLDGKERPHGRDAENRLVAVFGLGQCVCCDAHGHGQRVVVGAHLQRLARALLAHGGINQRRDMGHIHHI